MKALVLRAFGPAENFADADLPAPKLRPSDVLIRTKAVGFNPIDYQVRASGFERLATPVVRGFEVSGVVEGIGAAVSRVAIGDRVMTWLGAPSLAGGYAELAVAPEDLIAPLPSALSFAQAAAVPLSAATVREAHRLMESGHTIGKLVATVP